MTHNELTHAFRDALPRLDKFFHQKLKQIEFSGNREDCKNELIQMTSLKIMEAVSRGTLQNGYNFEVLLNINKKDIWSNFLSEAKNKPEIVEQELEELYVLTSDPYELFATNHEFNQLLKQISPEAAEMLRLITHGFNYHQIAEVQGTTEAAIKERLYRLRKRFNKKG